MSATTIDTIAQGQSLGDEWLALQLDRIDLIEACRLDDPERCHAIKKSYLELSGYALVAKKLGVGVHPAIEDFLSRDERADLLMALAARDAAFFSKYAIALACLAQNPRHAARVKAFLRAAPVLAACDPYDFAPQKMLDIAFAFRCAGLESPFRDTPACSRLIEGWGSVFHLGERHVYFLTHIAFFANGFGFEDWTHAPFRPGEALTEKALISCIAVNNLDGALEVVLTRLISGLPLGRLAEQIVLSAMAKLITYRRLDSYLWGVPGEAFEDVFHTVIVFNILAAVMRRRGVAVEPDFSSIDAAGLKACAVLGGLCQAAGDHDFARLEAGAALLDRAGLRRMLSRETRASLRADFLQLQTFLALGDGGGFGYFLPERLSGAPVDPATRLRLEAWFDSAPFHTLAD
ncbi:MAG: DUF6895 family protein [Oceanicaulis sp.]